MLTNSTMSYILEAFFHPQRYSVLVFTKNCREGEAARNGIFATSVGSGGGGRVGRLSL